MEDIFNYEIYTKESMHLNFLIKLIVNYLFLSDIIFEFKIGTLLLFI